MKAVRPAATNGSGIDNTAEERTFAGRAGKRQRPKQKSGSRIDKSCRNGLNHLHTLQTRRLLCRRRQVSVGNRRKGLRPGTLPVKGSHCMTTAIDVRELPA